jgi:23S rRNA (guanine745-N1)-methyltransferase
MTDSIKFKCPSCAEPLNKENKTYRCPNNHTYDEAKEGYVNLLLAQHKKSKNPGDNDEMIKSRQAFLNRGYYASLSSKIVEIIASSKERFNQNILDVGCGEGYYMNEIKKASIKENATLSLSGIDISKTAVKLAGKRKMNALLSVSSAYDLPFFSNSFDTIVSVFSPVSADEIGRLLKSENSHIIMVGPAEEHLKGLTTHIYDEVLPHKGNYSVLDDEKRFILEKEIEIKEEITVNREDILDLLRMTPYYWQTTVEIKEKILALDELKTTIHFYVRVYKILNS